MADNRSFKNLGVNEVRKLQNSLSVLYDAASYFKEFFVGQKVVYVTKDTELSLYFSATNFMHLCGLYYPRGAAQFFNDCLEKHLDITSIQVKKDGTTMQKLQVLSSIKDLTSPHVRLTGSGRYLYLDFDYALRTKKQILALTLIDADFKIVPQSLLDLKKMKTFPKGEAVTRIYSVDLNSNQKTIYYQNER